MKIIFVYNADSGRINNWFDIGHKLLSPDTYACNLCSLTHGVFAEREEWKRYRDSIDAELVFLHKDEFEKANDPGTSIRYPIILKELESGELEVLVSTEEINSLNNLDELIEKLEP